MNNLDQIFSDLLKSAEARKIDFKSAQYLLENDHLKSEFIKDILCFANSPGEDGYIVLGVKCDKGKPRELVGISMHYDSSDLEAIVNGVIEEPIQFEYFPLKYENRDYALIFIPTSKARPHWAKKDYGVLKKHVFYIRRSSGNREASIQEIRQICIDTMHISDVPQRKLKSSSHIIDELADFSLDERKDKMFKILKSLAPPVGLTNYRSMYSTFAHGREQICSICTNTNKGISKEYCVFMYPWKTTGDNIISSRIESGRLIKGNIGKKDLPKAIRERLMQSSTIHISYKDISTKTLEKKPFGSREWLRFANEWNPPWGKVIRWEGDQSSLIRDRLTGEKITKYEFFIPNVISKAEFKDRLLNLLSWVDSNII